MSARAEGGAALIVVLLAGGLLAAFGLGLTATSTFLRLGSANFDEAIALANASDAAIELAARELARVGNWNDVLAGTLASQLTDGPPGPRIVAGGVSLDLVRLTNEITCGRQTSCSDAQIRARTAERPWGANNPRWRLFLHQPLAGEGLPIPAAPVYVVVWVGDDARETDADPATDSAVAARDGRYIVRVRVESFGARGGRHALEAELVRSCDEDQEGERCSPGTRVHSWRIAAGAPP